MRWTCTFETDESPHAHASHSELPEAKGSTSLVKVGALGLDELAPPHLAGPSFLEPDAESDCLCASRCTLRYHLPEQGQVQDVIPSSTNLKL